MLVVVYFKRMINEIVAPSVLLGEEIENPQEFFLTEITRQNALCGCVGVVSYGMGLRPEFIEYEGFLIVGYNEKISIIKYEQFGLFKDINLETLFWKFLVIKSIPGVIVICETALLLIGDKGDVLWRIDTDLIINFEVEGQSVYITFSDFPPIHVDLITGLLIQA